METNGHNTDPGRGDGPLSADLPQAQVLKLPDGGFRPAYNLELATDVDSGVMVGAVTTADAGQVGPVEQRVAQRTGQHPGASLLDGGFATRGDITALTQRG